MVKFEIKGRSKAGKYTAEDTAVRIDGDYKTTETGVITELAGNVYTPKGEYVGSVNAYAANTGDLKVNINGISPDMVSAVASLLNEIIASIKADGSADETSDSE